MSLDHDSSGGAFHGTSAAWLVGPRALDLAMWFACAFTCVYVLTQSGFEGPWYRLQDAMSFTAIPPFRHRILFVLVARAIEAVRPAFHAPRCYFLSQVLAAGIAFWAIRPWAARFVAPAGAALSRPLLLLLLAPTFTYWTFYDIGIVACYTFALWALVERRFGWYLVVFALATLNHENSLLLVPVALMLRYGSWRIGARGVAWGALQLVLYAGLRMLLFRLFPVESAWQSGKLQYNLNLVIHDPAQIARAVLLVGVWLVMVGARWKRLPREIRWIFLILFPELVLVAIVVGQINELRLFDALMPVIVVSMLLAVGIEPRADAGRASGAPGAG